MGSLEITRLLLGRQPPRCEPKDPGGDDQGPIRACERLAEGIDGAAIRIESAVHVPREGDDVLEREVDHAVGLGSCRPQDVEIVEGALLHLHAGIGARRACR